MKLVKVNLLSSGAPSSDVPTGASPVKFFLSRALVVVLFLGSFAVGRLSMSQANPFSEGMLAEIPILRQVRFLVSSPDRELKGEKDDRINILLLGMGGEGHDGPNLTDTIMVASIRPSDGHVAMLSIPRDLLVPLPKRGWQKINAANVFGEKDEPGRGAELARDVIQDLLGFDIPYYVRVDFNGFKEMIDAVDGVDVYVERSFTDHTYPTSDYGVQTVSFKEGWRRFDGETALVYARSRHGTNGEGNDFARAKRQQKVIMALKDKMLSSGTYRNPKTISDLLAALKSNIKTNLQIGEIVRLARMAQDIDRDKIGQKVLDNGPDSPLTDGVYGGAYVLVPKNNDWGALREAALNVFDEAIVAAPEPPKPETAAPGTSAPAIKATVEIRNGSGASGVARTTAEATAKAGFTVGKIGNADTFEYEKTIVYDLTKGKNPDALSKIKGVVKASQTKSGAPKGEPSTADFVVIIGKDVLN